MKGKILVTGGAGFIGSHLVESLSNQGHQVTVLDNFSTGKPSHLANIGASLDVVQGSILDDQVLRACMKGRDTVYHLAAVSSVKESMDHPLMTHEINATGSLKVFEAARQEGARVIFSSSASVYGDTPKNPKSESDAVKPMSLYGAQKMLAENCLFAYSQAFGLKGISLRYFNVFGPRQDPASPYSGVISVFIHRALSGQNLRINGDGSATRDFVSVKDVVKANLAALHSDSGTFNVGTGIETSILQLAQLIIKLTNSSSQIEFGPGREADIQRSLADTSSAKVGLSFQSDTNLEDALTDTIQFIAEQQSAVSSR